MHLGSLVAAVGSFLDARRSGGRWLVRMEDLDVPRVVPGSDSQILRCLEALGLTWDGEVRYQSRQVEPYRQALTTLAARGLAYPCSCPRSTRATEHGARYPGTCRNGPTRPGPMALRFRINDDAKVRFEDRIQGHCEYSLSRLGDFVIRRRDGIPAYQLAVVIDDAAQAVTSVVRGADLLESTAWQIALAEELGIPRVSYAHLPIVIEHNGTKLAKSRHSLPIDPGEPGVWLAEALRLLKQPCPPEALLQGPVSDLIAWALENWQPERLYRTRTVSVSSNRFGSCQQMY